MEMLTEKEKSRYGTIEFDFFSIGLKLLSFQIQLEQTNVEQTSMMQLYL